MSQRYFEKAGQWYLEKKYGSKVKKIRVPLFTCCECGKRFPRLSSYVKDSTKVLCSLTCNGVRSRRAKGEKSGGWKGGRGKTSNGYVRLHKPDHPSADARGYVAEHRLVMEQQLGRPLYPFETVHHKNGIRDDNRPGNLELFVSNHPAGQTPRDLVKWAKEIIQLYGGLTCPT